MGMLLYNVCEYGGSASWSKWSTYPVCCCKAYQAYRLCYNVKPNILLQIPETCKTNVYSSLIIS